MSVRGVCGGGQLFATACAIIDASAAAGDESPADSTIGIAGSDVGGGGSSSGSGRGSGREGALPTLVPAPGLASGSASALNLHRLLWFWGEYYRHRGRDRLSLEASSHIAFAEWEATVAALREGPLAAFLATRLPVSPFQLPPSHLTSGPPRAFLLAR